jgi:hypothetical protein
MTETATKLIQVVSSRPPKSVLVEVEPSDTATAILTKAGLDPNDGMLMKPGDQDAYNNTDLPFDSLPESGGKLHVVPQSTVGYGA